VNIEFGVRDSRANRRSHCERAILRSGPHSRCPSPDADVGAMVTAAGRARPPSRDRMAATQESGRGSDVLSRFGRLVFIVVPVVALALGVAVAAVLALGWVIQHVIT
jgi:hypothetical protein